MPTFREFKGSDYASGGPRSIVSSGNPRHEVFQDSVFIHAIEVSKHASIDSLRLGRSGLASPVDAQLSHGTRQDLRDENNPTHAE
jgi:hypothetical protein